MSQRNLFVVGCPRSGTTALAQLLNTHPRICIGIERYGLLGFRQHFRIRPELFEYERFFSQEPKDTFYEDMYSFLPAYEQMKRKYQQSQWVGDKIPMMFRSIDLLIGHFPDAKVLFITRNIFHVAASYLRRARDPSDLTWKRDQGLDAAIKDWTDALFILDEMKSLRNIIPICYEKFFGSEEDIYALCDTLNVSCDGSFLESFIQFKRRFETLESHGSLGLDANEVIQIISASHLDTYQRLLKNLWQYP